MRYRNQTSRSLKDQHYAISVKYTLGMEHTIFLLARMCMPGTEHASWARE